APPRLLEQRDDRDARGGMLQASLLAGLAISQTRTALAHSISYPLTARFNLPHGIACSFTLPVLAAFNAAADDGRLHDLARATGFDDFTALGDGLRELFRATGVLDILRSCIPEIRVIAGLSGEMITPGRADNNLRPVLGTDLDMVLAKVIAEVENNFQPAGRAA